MAEKVDAVGKVGTVAQVCASESDDDLARPQWSHHARCKSLPAQFNIVHPISCQTKPAPVRGLYNAVDGGSKPAHNAEDRERKEESAVFNFSKLRGLMAEKGFTQADLSRALHVSENSISKKLNGKSYFSAEETCKIANLLGIGVSEIGVYFFTT